MLLKKLEIKGFKSFGDKVMIDFTEGVTGIVGPNGCGKSNVVDAIRWVLGEQRTKNLRSDKMSNVIFNGTRARGPGRTAEVSLTFNNNKQILPPEYSQVTITRRYHRNGDSEYMINFVPCRLKDIQDLFLDTGIGSDSYAIIELKKVDEILNDKENARRGLFEKAAGVSKYKNRKKQAMARLDGVDKDLNRVNDLLAEIEKNLNSLERQAKQAERYFRLKEQYKKASISYAYQRIKRERDAFLLLNDKLENETGKKEELQRLEANKEVVLEQKKQEVLQYEQHYSQKQKKLNNHLGQLRNLENEKKLKNERLSFSTEKTSSLKEQITQDSENKDNVYQSILQLEAQRGSAEKMWQELELELQNYKEVLEEQRERTAEIQQMATNKESFYKQKEQEAFQLNKDYEIKQTQLSAAKQELEKITSTDSQQNEELARYQLELTQIEKDLTEVNLRLKDWKEKEEQRKQEVQTLEETVEHIREKLSGKTREKDAKQNEYNLTKSLVDNMEGFPEALKFLKKNTEQWSKTTPHLLSDMITTRDEKYRVAIENYLEPFLNYYIVQNAADAYQAIQLLSENQKGKANFFILDHILPNSQVIDQSLGEKLPEAVHALEVTDFDPPYRPLFEHLLANVWLVPQTMFNDPAEHEISTLLKSSDVAINLVSLHGEIIRRVTTVSGGSVGAFEGKRIGRVKNLEKLSEEINLLVQEIEEIKSHLSVQQNNLQTRKQDQTFRTAIQENQQEVKHFEGLMISLNTKQEQLQSLLTQNIQARDEITERVATLQEEISDLLPQTANQKSTLEDLADEVETLKEQLLVENESLQMTSSRYNQHNITYHQQQNKLATIDQEIGYKQQTLTNLENRLVKYRQELVQVEVEAGQLLDSQESQDTLIEELQSKTETYSEEVKAAEKEYYAIRKLVNDLDKELRELQKNKESLSVILNELQNKIHETKINLTTISERLSVEFQVNIDQLMLDVQEDDSLAPDENLSEVELQAEVESIKRKLEKIGTINPMAMDQYKESKERRDFIVEQKDDLLKSKESLLQTIAETEEYAKNAFLEAYEKIRANFLTVFRSLFSEEDTADLQLTDPENPLESKIDIIAKPKGKRPLTINQLSGGEKTLTATSLLFALYLLKPAPFCIFDEVDAPLDDANTEKFNQIIKTFSKDSQFIIVTHNKRTMASTDIMYGVTMREQGVSTVVPVDLRALD